jgi:hypothetical protein
MIVLALLLLVAVVFIVIVVGINDSMKKENERLVEKNAALNEGLVAGREWIAKHAKMQPMDALEAIRKQDDFNHKQNPEGIWK